MSSHEEPVLIAVSSPIQWSAILAGTAAAAGLSFTLYAFAAGIGLSVMSASPTWRDTNAFLWALSGIYLLFVAITTFALGGYITTRLRSPLGALTRGTECNDGLHGLIMWGVAILVTAFLGLAVAAMGTSAVAPSSGAAGASQSVAGENTIATELDVLLRAPRDVSYLAYRRAEAARILLMADTHSGVSNPDRRYLAELTASVTGVGPTVAETRVNHAITAARTALRKARAAAVLQAFFVGVALLVGAAIAWFAAVEGGKDRESGTFFSWSHHRRWNE
jgi:hypothetical protein